MTQSPNRAPKMSFVKKILGKMSGEPAASDAEDEEGDESEDASTTESEDTGIFTGDLDGGGSHVLETDCAQISNFFGYWKNLINQEAKFQSELNDLSKQLSVRDAEANKLRFQMDELQRDVFAKSAGMDRLDAELQAAHKECETLRQRTRHLDSAADQHRLQSHALAELESTVAALQAKILALETQLEAVRGERDRLLAEQRRLAAERAALELKWRADFEAVRTVGILREQQTLDDFEWKLREVQQACKLKLDEREKGRLELERLRGAAAEHEAALAALRGQQEQVRLAEEGEVKTLRNLIQIERENLAHCQRLHRQEIVDKERMLKQTLHQKRGEIAMYWEERLLTECGRLKSELEQIHCEEKHFAMETVRRDKEEELQRAQREWEGKMKDLMKEITELKIKLVEKDEYYHEEIIQSQSNTDRDIMELRRLMDKIDMCHHERFEKLAQEHETELERINEETEERFKAVDTDCQNQLSQLRSQLDSVKEQMEHESQQKIANLIEQHRSELDSQWANLISQKSEAVQLVGEEYVSKHRILEEQVQIQQKSHQAREIELLKTIDSLKNELASKESALDDLQNNVDVLEGGIQVLNQEIAQQNVELGRVRKETEQKIRSLEQAIEKMEEQHGKECETSRLKYLASQKQNQETMEHLQRKCTCLTKLFEEVRLRYERRESRQEDINIISDLRQVVAEQEKDLACLNEEKRYFQMRLLKLEQQVENTAGTDDEQFEDAEGVKIVELPDSPPCYPPNGCPPPAYPNFGVVSQPSFSIPPTIVECDE